MAKSGTVLIASLIARRHRAVAVAVAVVVAALAGGCEVRDEAVRTEPRASVWPLPALAAGAGQRDRPPPAMPGIEYVEGYDAAARRAATAGMPLLLVFRAAWCRYSGALVAGPLAADPVVARSRRFVCATVDADRDAATCRDYGVSGFPTVILVDAQGRERFRATGSAAAGLVAAMDAVAATGGSTRAADAPEPDAIGDPSVVR